MSKIYSGDKPSLLYYQALADLLSKGDKCAPRGKKIKEIRPVIFEFTNPLNRVTFLKGRLINPFFQLAEALWIISGRSDVAWLTRYNASIGQFSDDGVYFNAPYGERLRAWNKNDSEGFIYNPIDQLHDVYKKIVLDKDTRQAVAVIYNPLFDHANKTTKDRPCNMILSFKVRNNKLDLNVFNRSNDIHWGVFGANLCQFATIQEVMANWLDVEVGTYYQTTDSLHVYLEDYGAAISDKVISAYGKTPGCGLPQIREYHSKNEPRMSSNITVFRGILKTYWGYLDQLLEQVSMEDPGTIDHEAHWEELVGVISDIPDDYWRMTLWSMVAYRSHKNGRTYSQLVKALENMPECSWKYSCLRFLHGHYGDNLWFQNLYLGYNRDIINYITRKGE